MPRALRFADGLSPERRAELLQRRADECYMTDQFEEAIDAQQRALDMPQTARRSAGEGDSLRSLSRLLFFAGRTERGRAGRARGGRAARATAAGTRVGDGVRQRLATTHGGGGRRGGGGLGRARARARANASTTPRRSSMRLRNIGAAQFRPGTHDGQRSSKRALALAEHHGLEDHAGRAFVILALGSMRTSGCSSSAAAIWRRASSTAVIGAWTRGGLYLLACRARVELALGRWDDAADSAALVLARSAQRPGRARVGAGDARTA